MVSEWLTGRAAAWWTVIGQRMKNIVLTDYTLKQWNSQMQVLYQSRDLTKKDALARKWKVGKEDSWYYVWVKAALFEDLDPRDRPVGVALILAILDGHPLTWGRISRTEFSHNLTVAELTKELQVLVPRCEKDQDRDRPYG